MTKLRNIGYLRFGSKILQGFAGFLPLSPLLSPSPLSGSRGQKMRVQREGRSFIFEEGACRPPAGRQAPCRPAGGRQAPSKDLCVIFFIYI